MNNLQMEKERIKQEELVNKINAMSPEGRRKYMARLAIKMRLDSAKHKDLQEHQTELDNIPREMQMKDWQVPTWILTHSLGGFMAGAMASANIPEVSAICDNIGVGMLTGAVTGFLTGMLNGVMYEKRPVTNIVNGIRKHLNEKKTQKLETKMELDQIVADGVVEMSAQGDYEDMEAYSNY